MAPGHGGSPSISKSSRLFERDEQDKHSHHSLSPLLREYLPTGRVWIIGDIWRCDTAGVSQRLRSMSGRQSLCVCVCVCVCVCGGICIIGRWKQLKTACVFGGGGGGAVSV